VRLHIEILRDRENVRKLLKKQGWRLDQAGSQPIYSARHPTVTDEASARWRLNESGLLISPALRIQFFPYAN
jgi:hypothetical protein